MDLATAMNLRADLDTPSVLRYSVAHKDIEVAHRMTRTAAAGVDKMVPRPALVHANLMLAMSALEDALDDLEPSKPTADVSASDVDPETLRKGLAEHGQDWRKALEE